MCEFINFIGCVMRSLSRYCFHYFVLMILLFLKTTRVEILDRLRSESRRYMKHMSIVEHLGSGLWVVEAFGQGLKI